MEFQDKVIVCEDCGKAFPHTAEDQRRYAERGFSTDPKRCRECRLARKERSAVQKAAPRQRSAGPRARAGAGGFRPGVRGGFREPRPARSFEERGPFRDREPQARSFGGGGGGFRGPAGPRQTFDAICSACGAATRLPFAPTPGREVFCRDCYRKLKEGT